MLATPEVIVSPPLADINKFLSKMVKSLVESTRAFVRWMHGTCIETPPQARNPNPNPNPTPNRNRNPNPNPNPHPDPNPNPNPNPHPIAFVVRSGGGRPGREAVSSPF